MTSKNLMVWVEGAIIAALSMALSFIPTNIGSSFTISLGMIPLSLYAFRRGVKPGLFAGLLWGLLHFLVGQVTFLSVSQVLIEYLVAFLFAGFAGIYSQKIIQATIDKQRGKLILYIGLGTFIGCLARFFWHFVAGVIFWGKYALWGMSPFVFSFVMNGVSGLATAVATFIILVLIASVQPAIFNPKK